MLTEILTNLPEWAPRLGEALLKTALISVLGFALAVMLGTALALALVAKSNLLRRLAKAYVLVFRGVPLLVVLFLLYFGLPGAGLVFSALSCAVLGLGLCFAAQIAEVLRAGFRAIPKGQGEAAAAVGLTPFQAFRTIVIPQVLRIVSGPMIVTFVSLMKDSSLASLITVQELVLEGRALATEYFLPLPIFICVGALYFALAFPLSMTARRLARSSGSATR
jgi:polar amino acid transport system permease protein